MINFLDRKDFNDTDKLLEAVLVIEKGMGQTIQELGRKI